LGPHCVIHLLVYMLRAIDFDDQLGFEAHEIHDVGPERMLAPEPVAADSAAAQVLPEGPFSLGRFASECAS